MEKQFISLYDDQIDATNPYKIKNWKKCDSLTADKKLSFNEIYQNQNVPRKPKKPNELGINKQELGTNYLKKSKIPVKLRKTPQELRTQDLHREEAIKLKEPHLKHETFLKSPNLSIIHETKENELIQVESPMNFVGKIKPKLATPQSSNTKLVLIPSKKMLELKKSKSGYFINETKINLDTTIPYDNYNPRTLQSDLNASRKIYSIQKSPVNQEMYATIVDKKNVKDKCSQIIFDRQSIVIGSVCIEECDEIEKSKLAKIFSFMAILYSKIYNPSAWTAHTIGTVFSLSTEYFKNFIKNNLDFHISNIPTITNIEGFRFEHHISATQYVGAFTAVCTYECSALTRAIRNFFQNTNAGLFEIDDVCLAIWRKKDKFYMFDPYGKDVNGFGCITMNIRLDVICESLNSNLMGMKNVNFAIYAIKVVRVDKIQINKYANIVPLKPRSNEMENEHITQVPDQELSDISLPKKKRKLNKIKIEPRQISNKMENDQLTRVPDLELSNIGLPKKKREPSIVNIETTKNNDVKDAENNYDDLKSIPNRAIETMDTVIDELVENVLKKCCKDKSTEHRAKRVLLKSDLGHLQKLLQNVHRGIDYDNIDVALTKQLSPIIGITLSKELLIPSNFQTMPDGSALIRGATNLLQFSMYNESLNVLASIIAVIVSQKYSIATWDCQIVDFILELTSFISNCIPIEKYSMFQGATHHFPNIKIGSKLYSLNSTVLASGFFHQLHIMLDNCIASHQRLILASTTYSIAIFKRNNFFYFFDGFPCDFVGIRTKEKKLGTACFQRFPHLEGLLHRIQCNGQHCNGKQSISIWKIDVHDITDKEAVGPYKFLNTGPSQENLLIQQLHADEIKTNLRCNEKIKFLNDEMKKERCRIRRFNKKANKRDLSIIKTQPNYFRTEHRKDSEDIEDDIASFENFFDSDSEEPPIVNSDDEKSVVKENSYEKLLKSPVGYKSVSADNLLRIIGTTSLQNRYETNSGRVRECHFVGLYACMLALHFPLETWNFRKIDQCIEEGLKIYAAVEDKKNCISRFINNILVNGYYYKVILKKFDIFNRIQSFSLTRSLHRFFSKHKYLLLQYSNCTFAIIKTDSYNLFDAYGTIKLQEYQPDEVQMEESREANNINTAYWVCIPNMRNLLRYIEQRIIKTKDKPDVNSKFYLYSINVVTFQKAPKISMYTHFMLSYLTKNSSIENYKDETPPMEEVAWLDGSKKQMVPWSRKLQNNLLNATRYQSSTMWKEYNIELPYDLYSLWSNIHPAATVFKEQFRNKQHLGVCVIACAMANIYNLNDWNRHLLDTIVVEGDKYFTEKFEQITERDYEIGLIDLAGEFEILPFRISVHIEPFLYGKLYSNGMNLSKALIYMFQQNTSHNEYGILQCFGKCLAFGRTPKYGYFMFDCQSMNGPLFQDGQGCAYVLKCLSLKRLLHCIIMTLQIPYYNIEFYIHSLKFKIKPIVEEINVAEDEDEDEEEHNAEEDE